MNKAELFFGPIFDSSSCEEWPKQEEKGREKARVHRELCAESWYWADDQQGSQGPSGNFPLSLPAGQIHYGQ